ncbi:MAG TPA: hypothetical protein PKL83_00215, partial [bacterium]|nr:hypothetical protein [bacterium]
MSQLSDEEILNRIESSGANEHQPADALAEILQQFRNERAAPDSRFQQELEKSLLARQTAEPAKQNLFMLVWRNVNMRKITYAAVPSLALLVIAAIII